MNDGNDPSRSIGLLAGAGLVLAGAWFMLRSQGLVTDLQVGMWSQAAWPIALIIVGIGLIVVSQRGGLTFRGPLPGAKLYKSRSDKWVDGVLGGLGRYLGMDPVLLRLAFIVLMLAGWGGIVVAYIVMAVLMPREPLQEGVPVEATGAPPAPEAPRALEPAPSPEPPAPDA